MGKYNEKETMIMKGLHRASKICMGLLVAVIVAAASMGVVAATGGYVLWTGTADIQVDEAITIYYGNTQESCDTLLVLGGDMPDLNLWPGQCRDTWFKFTNASPGNLLVQADVIVTAESAGDPVDVTVEFFDVGDNPSPIDDAGLVINSSDGAVYLYRTVCVNGTAIPDWYYVTTTFTRESPPVP
jgi:hypothetical protein